MTALLRGPSPTRMAVASVLALAAASGVIPARAAGTSIQLSAPVYRQTRSLDCEAAALQIALAAKGIAVSQDWIVATIGADTRPPQLGNGAVLRWGDPYQTFVGSVDGSEPGYTGYGVYPPPVALAAQRAGASAMPLQGADPQSLYRQVLSGNPVVAWVVNHLGTTTLRTWIAWDGRTVPYSVGEHVVTLLGVDSDAGTVTLADPGEGLRTTVTMQRFEASYNSFGRMAVVVGAGYVETVPSPSATGSPPPVLTGGSAASATPGHPRPCRRCS